MWLVAVGREGRSGRRRQFLDIGRTEVRQLASLGMTPNHFHRIEIRCVGRQELCGDLRMPLQIRLHHPRLVSLQAVPAYHQGAELPTQILQLPTTGSSGRSAVHTRSRGVGGLVRSRTFQWPRPCESAWCGKRASETPLGEPRSGPPAASARAPSRRGRSAWRFAAGLFFQAFPGRLPPRFDCGGIPFVGHELGLLP